VNAGTAAVEGERERESDMVDQWADGLRGPLRLEDGRAVRVVFPGHRGRGPGPDYRDALLEVGGDLLRGAVEFHLLASGWRAHGHLHDQKYDAVVLHVVRANDTSSLTSPTSSGRSVPLLTLPAVGRRPAFPPPFTPPCVFAQSQGFDIPGTLDRLSRRRLRMKSARIAPLVRERGPGQALYLLLLEQLGGSANRAEFGRLGARLPLAALLERCDEEHEGVTAGRAHRFAAELRGVAAGLALRRAGLRPMASPGRRLDAAAALFGWLWPANAAPAWPERLTPGARIPPVPGLGTGTIAELMLNAVLPVALASAAWPVETVEAAWFKAGNPGTYGKLKQLETWLSTPGSRAFPSAAHLQGAILLHQDYCTRGMCGRCPLSKH
jgi:hypothetical protein